MGFLGRLEKTKREVFQNQTCHYERRDDGFYIAWGADFAGDDAGEQRLSDETQEVLEALDPATQVMYMDLRTRTLSGVQTGAMPGGVKRVAGVNEMGRCRRCNGYVPPLVETEEPHVCDDLIAEGEQHERS